MARLPRIYLPGIAQHIIQRGNNRQVCFGANDDFAAYAHWLEEYADKYHLAVHAWVFMTNHVHLLLTPRMADGVSLLCSHSTDDMFATSTIVINVVVPCGKGASGLAWWRMIPTYYCVSGILS